MIASCEKEMKNARIPEFKKQLVITSFISPSDTISVISVSANSNLFGEITGSAVPGNLTGTISDGQRTIQLQQDTRRMYFPSSNMKVDYGKNYTVTITSDEGLKATGTCNVPPYREIITSTDTVKSSFISPYDGRIITSVNLHVTIRDIPGEENYYRIIGKIGGYYYNENLRQTQVAENYVTFEKEFLTDKGNDGGEINVSTISGIGYFYSMDSVFFSLYLLNTEKSYYLYHKSLNDYEGGENPFTEPSPVYTNITDGLGIFTSFTTDTMIYRLK